MAGKRCECGRRVKHAYLGACDRCAWLDSGAIPGNGRPTLQADVIAALRSRGYGATTAELVALMPGKRLMSATHRILEGLERKGRLGKRTVGVEKKSFGFAGDRHVQQVNWWYLVAGDA